ncbi:MAG: hydrogenase expression/formation protein [Chloroflexi bacterium]|nr:hydrogenase expression/formation protein [Chloroflexota bacterium]
MSGLKAGKLPADLLARLLKTVDTSGDPSVVLGPRPGEDAAVIDPGTELIVAKTDPITFATDRIGWYAVQVNANDVAATGGVPRWFMATLFIPEGSDPSLPEDVFTQLQSACKSLNVSLIGGHTEITVDLPRPILSGAMLGTVGRGKEISTSGAQVGDKLILTSGIAVEGTAILATQAADRLRESGVEEAILTRARKFLDEPGISVVKDAGVAVAVGGVHSMHDPTEGGLATGIAEMCRSSGVGVTIKGDSVRMYPEAMAICQALKLDAWGLIASGALLIAADPAKSDEIVNAIRKKGRHAEIIGELTPQSAGLEIEENGRSRPLPEFERDEIARYFGGK